MESLSANKKIIITSGAFLLIVVFLAIGLKLAGSNNNVQQPVEETTSTTTYSGYVEEASESAFADETTSAPVSATIPEIRNDVSETVANAIIAYMSGQYFIDGSLTSGGEVTDVNIAISGKDFYTSTQIEGLSVSILYKSGKIYFINNDRNQYIELSDVMMGSYDFDFTEVEELTEYLNLTQYNFTGFERYDDSVNGRQQIAIFTITMK